LVKEVSVVTDFRNVGRIPRPGEEAQAAAKTNLTARIVTQVLYSSAAGFFVGGLWLLFGTQAFFAPDVAQYMGIGLVVGAVADVIAVQVLQRVWAKQAEQA
jgi:hypothetical protein